MAITEISSLQDFNNVHASSMGKLVVIDFTATWCGPCRMISPIFKQLADDFAGKAIFCKCDVDAAQDVTRQEKISAMPSFNFYVNGQRIDQIVGADATQLKSKVQTLAAKHSVFSSKGHSLVPGTSKTSSTSSSSKSADRAPPKRVNPWANPNFIPPGMRQSGPVDAAKKKPTDEPTSSTVMGHHGPKTPWSNPSFMPAPTETIAKPSTQSDPKPKESTSDADLAKAIAMSLDVEQPASEPKNDPNLVSKISQPLVAELVDMGFPRLRAEKALILTNAKTLEDATNWLIEHEQDADIDEPLTIVDTAPSGASKMEEMYDDEDDGLSEAIRSVREKAAKAKEEARQLALQGHEEVDMSKMTKEEKLAYLERLKAVRKTQREKQEREEAKQNEIERQKNVKAALEAKRAREEQQAAMAATRAKREKEAERARQKRIEDKLKAEKEARIKARLEREKQKAQAEASDPK